MAVRNSELYPAYFKDVRDRTELSADDVIRLFDGENKPLEANKALGYMLLGRPCSVEDYEEIDVYAVCSLYNIGDPTGGISHGFKKLLLCGQRTGGKSVDKDLQEAYDAIQRAIELNKKQGYGVPTRWKLAMNALKEYER